MKFTAHKKFCFFKRMVLIAFLLSWPFFSFTSVSSDWALAQEVAAAPVEINGDTVEFSMGKNRVVARGNVSVVRNDVTLLCDQVEYFKDKNIAVAEGNVVLIKDGKRLLGDKLKYNFNTMKGDFSDVTIYAKPFYGVGKKIEKIGENHLRITDGYLTTSDFDNPEYRLRSKTIDVYPGDKAVARHVRFFVGGLPLMYLFRYTQDLKGKEPTVIVTPGRDKDWGGFLLTKWRYKLNEDLKGWLHLDYRERKDFAWGIDLDYKMTDYGKGIIRTYYMNERALPGKDHVWDNHLDPTTEKERFKVEWRHKWAIDDNTDAIWQYYKLSDSTLLKDYFEREYEEDSNPETFFLLTRILPAGTLSFRTDARVNRFVEAVERLPEISYSLPGQKIGGTGFYLKDTTTFSNLNKKFPSPSADHKETVRLDTDNELSYPFKISFIEVNPFVGGRQTYYSRTKDKAQYNVVRTLFKTGADLSTKFYRVFDADTDVWNLDINQLRHVVTPSIAYKYQTDPSIASSLLDSFDSIDTQVREHKIAFSAENKLQTKRDEKSVDLARLVIESNYHLKEHTGRTGFNDVTSDLEIKPYDWLTFYFDSSYNMMENELTSANFDFYVNDESDKWYVKLGKRYHVDVDDQVTTEIGYRFNQKWKFSIYERFDIDTTKLKEQQYTLTRDLHTWLMDISFNQTRGEGSEIWFVFTLKAFPKLGFDVGTGFNKRKSGSQSSE